MVPQGEPGKPVYGIVKVFQGRQKLIDTCLEIEEDENFGQLFARSIEKQTDYSVQVFISQTTPPVGGGAEERSTKHGTNCPLSAPVKMLLCDFQCKYITYYVQQKTDSREESHIKRNAFDIMMKERLNDSYLPQRIDKEKLIATEKVYNMVIDYMQKVRAGFTSDYVQSGGKRLAVVLRDALWYLDSHHEKFKERSIILPKAFQIFQHHNNWKQNKHTQPSLTQEGLYSHEQSISAVLMLPMVLTQRNSVLARDMSDLCKAMTKYRLYLQKSTVRVEKCRSSTIPVRSVETHSSLTTIPASAVCPQEYQELQRHLDKNAPYTPVDIGDFVTVDRYERRKYIANIQLVSDVSMYAMPYGNCLGTVTILWKIERNSENHESRNAGVILEISKELPTYSTREMRRMFIQTYSKRASIKPMVLRAIYRELVNDSAAAASFREEDLDHRVVRFFMESEQPDLLLDLRKLNGNPGSTMFNAFWEETAKYFEEQAQVHDRRHEHNFTYMPVAISVEELRLKVKDRLPEGTPIPSSEWLRLQFWPANPFAARAIKHTFRLDVKFAVQTRLLRSEHIDSKYATTQYKYLKQFACKYKDHARLICVDDKAIVPVGNPRQPVSTGVRGHNRSLAPVGGTLAALDHDWHVGGLVPSVVLLTDIPERAEDSFYRGKVCVTLKEKVFQPSSPSRHTAEIAKVLREYASLDDVNLDVPILLMFSDGGPDHRVTFQSVKIALLALFLALDLDALYAARCAPHGSWINPAERTMSLLNLALQNVALERGCMSGELEKLIRGKSDLSSVRQSAKRHPDLKEGFKAAMQPVVRLVSERFRKMRLKEEKVRTFPAALDEEIEDIMSILSLIDEEITPRDVITMTSKDFARRQRLTSFLEKHSKQTHYTFQLKKCTSASCNVCVLSPARLPPEVFDTLSFLPDPMLDPSGEHYLSFAELYGKPTTEADRPSLKQPTQKSETDKKRKQLLVAAKVRDVISCGECRKPRCIYAASKLLAEEGGAVTRAQQDGTYVCGGDIFAEGGRYHDKIVTRVDQTCASPVETQYYGSVTVAFPDCCFHCGTLSNLLEQTDPYILELRQSFHTVRPICSPCHAGGKQASTRGPTNARKKIRKI